MSNNDERRQLTPSLNKGERAGVVVHLKVHISLLLLNKENSALNRMFIFLATIKLHFKTDNYF